MYNIGLISLFVVFQKLPNAFNMFFKSESGDCNVRVSGGKLYPVSFYKLLNGKVLLMHGWKQFADHYRLHHCKELRFVYYDSFSFKVRAYGSNDIEKKFYPANGRCTCPITNETRTQPPTQQLKYSAPRTVVSKSPTPIPGPNRLLAIFSLNLGCWREMPDILACPWHPILDEFGPRTWKLVTDLGVWLVSLENVDGSTYFTTGLRDFMVDNKFQRGTYLDVKVFGPEHPYMKVTIQAVYKTRDW